MYDNGEEKQLVKYELDEKHEIHCNKLFLEKDKTKYPYFRIIKMHRGSLEPIVVAFDGRAYLTNNEGKTIERF